MRVMSWTHSGKLTGSKAAAGSAPPPRWKLSPVAASVAAVAARNSRRDGRKGGDSAVMVSSLQFDGGTHGNLVEPTNPFPVGVDLVERSRPNSQEGARGSKFSFGFD